MDLEQQSVIPDIKVENTILRELEEEDAIRRLEDVVDTMTDMAHIRRNSRTKDEHQMEISPALVKEAIEAFNLFDRKGRHGLDIDGLAHVFRAVGQNPSDAELREIMKNFDLDDNGLLNQEEFEKMIVTYMKPMWQVREELKDAFRIFDRTGKGEINKTDFVDFLCEVDQPDYFKTHYPHNARRKSQAGLPSQH
ncbi:uncharacterized protein LOC123540974 isoform X2 [Mercenaria mercenaria]|uniref:uncharacterized protein LOC123540974 isoform X2 n=1 Tax=Mercenaria mercenaria TaxID=6596 RepID=UPI001E1D2C9D|nr:uncharacterized protein LOC123540974 isoform X2 [Mercenaria mercenaria]